MKLGLSRVRRHVKLLILLALFEWLAIGAGLVVVTVTTKTSTSVSTQVAECNQVVAAPLFMGQWVSYECTAASGSWAQATIGTKYGAELALLFAPISGGSETVYNSTGSHFNVLIPVFSDGTFTLRIRNMGPSGNVATGSMSVNEIVTSSVLIPSPKHPFRTIAAVILVVAGLGVAFVAFDPGRRLAKLGQTPGAPN